MKNLSVKQLERRIADLNGEVTELQLKQSVTAKQIMEAKGKCGKLRATLRSKTANLVVSEHAMLRYLERVELVDLQEIAALVLPEDKKETIKTLGSGKYPINDHRVVVVDNVVVTVEVTK